jgi:hypothetical protein
LSEPHLYTFLFTEPRSGARRFPHDMRAGLSPTLNTVVAGLCEGRDRGTFSFTDEWEVALIIAAEVHGLVQLLHGGRLAMDEQSFRSLCERAVRVILEAYRA